MIRRRREPIPVGAPVRWEGGRIIGRVVSSSEDLGGIRWDARITDVQVAGILRSTPEAVYRSPEEQAVWYCRHRGHPPELAPLALLAVRIDAAYEALGEACDRVWPGQTSDVAVP